MFAFSNELLKAAMSQAELEMRQVLCVQISW